MSKAIGQIVSLSLSKFNYSLDVRRAIEGKKSVKTSPRKKEENAMQKPQQPQLLT